MLRKIVREEIKNGLDEFNQFLERIECDVQEIKSDIKVIVRRFVNIDKVSASTTKELQEIVERD